MNRLIKLLVVTTILAATVMAADAPKPTAVDDANQVKVLKAKLALSDAQNEFVALQVQYQDLDKRMADLRAQAGPVQKKIADADKALKDLTDSVAKGLGLDPAKFDFDTAKMVFVPKTEPAPATPSPAKK